MPTNRREKVDWVLRFLSTGGLVMLTEKSPWAKERDIVYHTAPQFGIRDGSVMALSLWKALTRRPETLAVPAVWWLDSNEKHRTTEREVKPHTNFNRWTREFKEDE